MAAGRQPVGMEPQPCVGRVGQPAKLNSSWPRGAGLGRGLNWSRPDLGQRAISSRTLARGNAGRP